MKTLIHLILFLFLGIVTNGQTIIPIAWYDFDQANQFAPKIGTTNFSTTGMYRVETAGPNGKSLVIKRDSSTAIIGQSIATNQQITVQMLFKAGRDFGNNRDMTLFSWGTVSAKFAFPDLTFTTQTANGSDGVIVSMDGSGKKSWGYYIDGNWHHLAFVYNSATGEKKIYVDGLCPDGFSDVLLPGAITQSTNQRFTLNSQTTYIRYDGYIDEVAVYTQAFTARHVYQSYLEAMAGLKYTGTQAATVPTPAAVTGTYDMTEFAKGSTIGAANSANCTNSALYQLQHYPSPRLKLNEGLLTNFNWVNLRYLSEWKQPGITDPIMIGIAKKINAELVENWHYNYVVSQNFNEFGQVNDPTKFSGAMVQQANLHPEWPIQLTTFWAQIKPSVHGYAATLPYVESKTNPNSHYLQDSSGSFMRLNGTSGSPTKFLAPDAPLDSLKQDGRCARIQVQAFVNALSSRPTPKINFISENAEVLSRPSVTAMTRDPSVYQDFLTSGFSSMLEYQGNRWYRMTKVMRDSIMSVPGLVGAKFSLYQVFGWDGTGGIQNFFSDYSWNRLNIDTINGMHYSTPDAYVRYHDNWWKWLSAWRGWFPLVQARNREINLGDKLFAPFVASGWAEKEESNPRPGRWLGFCKGLSMLGAEYFNTAFFWINSSYDPPAPPPAHPKGMAWQVVMPVYAQGTTSFYEKFLRHGYLLPGDTPDEYVNQVGPGYVYWTGDVRKLVVARKDSTTNEYILFGTIQPNAAIQENCPREDSATIFFAGDTMKFNVRQQGSTYYYDRRVPSAKVFVQLDAWHEYKHPEYWSQDFAFEAEVTDNATYPPLKTWPQAPNDYRTFLTAVSYPNGAVIDTLRYCFEPRTDTTLYLWVKLKSRTGAQTSLKIYMDGGQLKTISPISDQAWYWYRLQASTKIKYVHLDSIRHVLALMPGNDKLEIDQIVLTPDSNKVFLPEKTFAPCTPAAAVISAANDTVCRGDSMLLLVNNAISYAWSTGATTQGIYASTTGTYTVTITDILGCTGTTSAVLRVVCGTPYCPAISAAISAANDSICIGDSMLLLAAANPSYLWSTGATTQGIYAKTTGNYTVTVTAGNTCTASSSFGITATVCTPPPCMTDITPGGATTICTGDSVQLVVNPALTYLWSTGATTQSIYAKTTGNYIVTITGAGPCTGGDTIAVTANACTPPPCVTDITPGGSTTFCQWDSVLLIANTAVSYIWSTGATTQSIYAKTTGNYIVTITGSNGCTGRDTIPVAVNICPLPCSPVSTNIIAGGPTQICSTDSVALTANSAVSYLWSNGKTTRTIYARLAGAYVVQITDINGCTGTDTITVTVNNCTPATCQTPQNFKMTLVTKWRAEFEWTKQSSGVVGHEFAVFDSLTQVWRYIPLSQRAQARITSGIRPGRIYKVKVRTVCTGNRYSPWTTEYIFRSEPEPTTVNN